LIASFWFHVKPPSGIGECWQWFGALDIGGYGKFRDRQAKRSFQAHRYAYEQIIGPIPEGLTLDHLCRNRACVNPYHLEPVTHKINSLRGVGACAQKARQTHCKNGHPLVESNLVRSHLGLGHRVCRICYNENHRGHRENHREYYRKYSTEYRDKHRDYYIEYCKKYRLKIKEMNVLR
jgi:HNH endonuclease